MPVMDGIEATRQLRQMPQFATLPIVALTAGAFKSQQDAAHAAGMTHFISKPFDVPSTIAMIQRLTWRRAALDAQHETQALGLTPTAAIGVDAATNPEVMDMAKGLDTWDDMSTYQDYLQRFVATYRNAVVALNDSLRHDDRPAAIALAHKLAGVAANMALPQTFRSAAEVERVLKNELDPTLALAHLDAALLVVLATVARLAASTAPQK